MSFDKKAFFRIPTVNTVFSGAESVRFFNPEIWDLTPNKIKCYENLRDFKIAVKKQKPTSSSCRIFKTYLHGGENWSQWWTKIA